MKQLVLVTQSSFALIVYVVLGLLMLLPNEIQAGEFPKSVRGSDNPEIIWTVNGDELRLALGWKSNYDQTLNLMEVFADEEGHVCVKAETSCHGCYIRLYRKHGDGWNKLDEKKAEANTTYTLRAVVRAPSGEFPRSVRGAKNPYMTWTTDEEEFMLVLGWKSDYDQALKIEDASMDEEGYINVKAETSCHGCILRLYRKEGGSWTKLDEEKAHAHETYTLRGLVKAAGRGFPQSVSGSKNPRITWTMDEEEFMLVLGWKSDYDQTLNIQEASIDDEGFINVKTDTSCHGCYIRLYRKEGDTWSKLGEKKAHAGETYVLRNFAR